jgi:hypothetical protein
MRIQAKEVWTGLARVTARSGCRASQAILRGIGSAGPVLYHIALVALSAGIALFLPKLFIALARNLLTYWAIIENERVFLTALEVVAATLLILLFDFLKRAWRDRRLSKMARDAGMIYFTSNGKLLAKRRVRRLRERQAFGKDIMLIGSTGLRTFVDPGGDLHNVLKHSREARILLLNPFSDGARARAKAILDPEITPEKLRSQIWQSIQFLKGLRETQKAVRLKLYPEAPFLKMAILGDYLWLQHYQAGLDVRYMPECVLRYDQNPRSLYTVFYDYFLRRWNSLDAPEYDLDTDELVYRDAAEKEVHREAFPPERVGGSAGGPPSMASGDTLTGGALRQW